jgi:uncharacterized repeat protein (TIGR03803 family)
MALVLASAISAQAQKFILLHTFNHSDGAEPQSALVRDASGVLSGTTEYGGSIADAGVVFKLNAIGTEKVFYSFQDAPDGARPFANLLGGRYGTTYSGGINCNPPYNCGTVFKLDSNGKETVLYRFKGAPDGENPHGALVKDQKRNLYGTTVLGGDPNCNAPFGCGVVFKVDASGKETVLYTFTGAPDGDSPYGSLIADPAGNLYGTTSYGGVVNQPCPIGCGIIFRLTPTSTGWKYKILHQFTGGADGASPYAGLTRDASGNFYGTTAGGGPRNQGTAFKLTATFKLSILYSFKGGADGSEPFADLVRDSGGNLYGTTVFGGTNTSNCSSGCGTVFKVDPTGRKTTLHAFNDRDGRNPYSALLLDSASRVLYGTASLGGNLNCDAGHGDGPGCGTVFKINY